jgi:chromosome segregation ATPase
MRALRDTIEELRHEVERSREAAAQAERRASAASHEAEEARTLLDTSERIKRTIESELASARDGLNEAMSQYQGLAASKRSLEGDYAGLKAELEEMISAMRNSEEKAKRAALDAMKLAEEARMQHDRADKEEVERRALDAHIKELQIQLEEAEANCLRGGRKLIEKLEAQIRNLTSELDMEARYKGDLVKNGRKAERRYREMEFQFEEEHKNAGRLQVITDNNQHFNVLKTQCLPISVSNTVFTVTG